MIVMPKIVITSFRVFIWSTYKQLYEQPCENAFISYVQEQCVHLLVTQEQLVRESELVSPLIYSDYPPGGYITTGPNLQWM